MHDTLLPKKRDRVSPARAARRAAALIPSSSSSQASTITTMGSCSSSDDSDDFFRADGGRAALESLRSNDPSQLHANLGGLYRPGKSMTNSAWKQLGEILAANTQVRWLHLNNNNTISLPPEGFKLFLRELKRNKSITEIDLSCTAKEVLLEGENIQVLSEYLHHENCYVRDDDCNLGHLILREMYLDDKDLRKLLPVLNGTRLETLSLAENFLSVAAAQSLDAAISGSSGSLELGGRNDNKRERVQANLSYVFQHLDMPELYLLNLARCGFGRVEVSALSILIERNLPKLETLVLSNNKIDDECCSILIRALRGNDSLKYLYLASDDVSISAITETGHDQFLRFVYDDSSINGTYASNHSIEIISLKQYFYESPILYALNKALHINEENVTTHEKGRVKIARAHFQGNFDVAEIARYNVKLMPHVMSFLMKESSFNSIYHQLRNWNVEELFGFA